MLSLNGIQAELLDILDKEKEKESNKQKKKQRKAGRLSLEAQESSQAPVGVAYGGDDEIEYPQAYIDYAEGQNGTHDEQKPGVRG